VELDVVSLEELISEAGVSRSAVHRRWPHPHLFLRDLVKELARSAVPTFVEEEIVAVERVIAERADELETPEDRDRLVAEIIRRLGLMDFETLYQSAKWRTYLALNATCESSTGDDTRDEVRAVLAQSEQAHVRAVAKAMELLTGLLGYRLRPESGASFETLAILMSASMRGLITMASSDRSLATQRLQAAPFWPVERSEWSLPAMAVASTITALLEPDPEIDWGAESATALRELVSAIRQVRPDDV
jgi:AcrR family transcriptional regulator